MVHQYQSWFRIAALMTRDVPRSRWCSSPGRRSVGDQGAAAGAYVPRRDALRIDCCSSAPRITGLAGEVDDFTARCWPHNLDLSSFFSTLLGRTARRRRFEWVKLGRFTFANTDRQKKLAVSGVPRVPSPLQSPLIVLASVAGDPVIASEALRPFGVPRVRTP